MHVQTFALKQPVRIKSTGQTGIIRSAGYLDNEMRGEVYYEVFIRVAADHREDHLKPVVERDLEIA